MRDEHRANWGPSTQAFHLQLCLRIPCCDPKREKSTARNTASRSCPKLSSFNAVTVAIMMLTVTAVVDVGMPPREEARRRGNATCTSLVRLSMFVSSPGALAAVIHVVVRQFHRLDVTDSPIFGSIWMPSGRSLALAEQAKVRASLLLQSMMVLTELH